VKKLILVRHSNAEAGSFSTPDFKRKLTPMGKNIANLQASRIANKKIIPDLIITSTALRAQETTDIFINVLKFNGLVQSHGFLYEDFTTFDFFELINNISESYHTVLIVGHNPTISIMASRLDSNVMVSFSPCTVAVFETNNNWTSIEVDSCSIKELMQP